MALLHILTVAGLFWLEGLMVELPAGMLLAYIEDVSDMRRPVRASEYLSTSDCENMVLTTSPRLQ